MSARATLLVLLGLVLGSVPTVAAAETRCVDQGRPEACSEDLAAALAVAQDGDQIEVAAGTDASGPWTVGVPLRIVGVPGTVLEGDLRMGPGAELTGLTLEGSLELAGRAWRVRVEGQPSTAAVRLLDGGALASASVRGRGTAVSVPGGAARIDSVEIRVVSGDGVVARCTADEDAALVARHVTLLGTHADTGVSASCEHPDRDAAVTLSDSIVWGAFAGSPLDGRVTTAYTDHPEVAGGPRSATDLAVDPGFAGEDDLRLAAGSGLLDAGDPAPLAVVESVEDATGLARVADGQGDGVVRRDIGAHERPAAVVAPPAGNVLANPGAEEGTTSWAGPLVAESFGAFPFPSRETGLALGAGTRFFSGGVAAEATGRQTVDLSPLAPEIDAGGARAVLSALLGGYRADEDEGTVTAAFKDPQGAPLGTIALATVTPAERAHGITLVSRRSSGTLPPLARSVEVSLRSVRRGAGNYADAYFDNVALVLDIPGLPPGTGPVGPGTGPEGGHPGPAHPPPARSFAGVTVLTGNATLDARGRAPVRLACASATVGRCAGVLTLTTVPRSRHPARRIGSARFTLAPGRVASVRVAIPKAWRKHLRRVKRLKLRLYAAARDGQGEARATTSPLTLRRAAPVKKSR